MAKPIISADSHITEPPNTYVDRIDAKFRDRAPHVVHDPKRGDLFVIEGISKPIPMGLVAAAGKRAEELTVFGVRFEDLHRGGWDPHARLADQDRDGVAAEILYPTVGMMLCNHPDFDFKHACFAAYNEWIGEYASAHPDRLLGIGQTAMRSVEDGIRDLQRIKALGLRGVMMPGNPALADYDDPMYDPFWEAAVDLKLPLSFHILTSTSDTFKTRGPKLNAFMSIIRGCQDIIGMFIFGGVFERHPGLRLVCVEADAGWVPHFMYRMDHAYDRHRYWLTGSAITRLPSEYFREHVYTTFQDDWTAFQVKDLCNIRRLMWANDFPHSDSTWPDSQAVLAKQAAHLTEAERDLVLHDNVAELYGLGGLSMTYDLVIRGGTVVDGSGLPRYRADVGIRGDRIARIGTIHGRGREEVDARHRVVAPGFIDGHTHMDAQVAWDPLGTSSCWHGVTSVVMGNCGFTLAPCRPDERHLVVRNLERAEDIPAEAMQAGIEWTWETYAQYLDAVARWPKGINYAGYVGHSALRTYAMGERAFSEPATAEDLAMMKRELADALAAGAMGFTTSRTRNHETADRRPVASRVAEWSEVRELVRTMGDLGAGIFEIAGEDTGRDPDRQRDYLERLRDLAVETGVPTTWGMFSSRFAPDAWRAYFAMLEETARAGGRMFAQVHSRALALVLSFETRLPFDRLPGWRDVRQRPLDEQRALLRDADVRRRLVKAAAEAEYGRAVGAEARKPDYEWTMLMEDPCGPHRSIAEIARERGVDPVEALIELALERDLKAFFVQPLFNENLDDVLEMMKHRHSVVTFSDSGAHVSQIMDSSLQTQVLAYWVRRRQALTLEEGVRMLTLEPASAWGLHERGLLREGLAADLVVFDPDRVAPLMPEVADDLPAGARRLRQKATGFAASIVNGVVVLRDGEHTGAYPGRLLRGPLAEGVSR